MPFGNWCVEQLSYHHYVKEGEYVSICIRSFSDSWSMKHQSRWGRIQSDWNLENMETSQETRGKIIALHTEGHSKAYIARRLAISPHTVARWIRRFIDSGNTRQTKTWTTSVHYTGARQSYRKYLWCWSFYSNNIGIVYVWPPLHDANHQKQATFQWTFWTQTSA